MPSGAAVAGYKKRVIVEIGNNCAQNRSSGWRFLREHWSDVLCIRNPRDRHGLRDCQLHSYRQQQWIQDNWAMVCQLRDPESSLQAVIDLHFVTGSLRLNQMPMGGLIYQAMWFW